MDYCHACRRHLNGALACAGCGTPAEELRRTEAVEPAVQDDFDLGVVEPAGHRRAASPRPPAARGRAAARASRSRRAHRRRHRKVMFGSLGLILAAGALSLAELAIEQPGEDRASTVVQEDDVPPEQPVVEPSGIQAPEPVGEVTAEPSVRSSGSADPSASTGAEPSPSESAEVTESPSSSPPQDPDPDPDTDPDPDPDASESAGDPSPQPSTSRPAPPPEPEPTETCVKFLWWCT